MVKGRSSGYVPLLSSRGEVTESDIAGVISSWTGVNDTRNDLALYLPE